MFSIKKDNLYLRQVISYKDKTAVFSGAKSAIVWSNPTSANAFADFFGLVNYTVVINNQSQRTL